MIESIYSQLSSTQIYKPKIRVKVKTTDSIFYWNLKVSISQLAAK